jgi:3-oxoacyl-[acyl-carrier protein] reductase
MSDFLVRLSANKAASGLVKGLGIPLPVPLLRADTPWRAALLEGATLLHGSGTGATLGDAIAATLQRTGARLLSPGDTLDRAAFDGLVFDATGLTDPNGLDEIYQFFHDNVRALAANGRAIIVQRPPGSAVNAIERAARRAVEGFVRSLGRELGRKGATAQVVIVDDGAEDRLEALLRFLLARNSAYISGQKLHLSTSIEAEGSAVFEQPLKGKVALVTGAARGIGEATARTLAREGAAVVIMDRPAELDAAQAVASEIGGTALGVDITDPEAAAKIREHLASHHGGLDILVHNAGVTRDKTLANMDKDRWDMVLDINLRCLIALNEALLNDIRDGGRIICLSSIGGIAGNVGQTNYAATKAGVIGYVEGLAPALQARRITVNAVAPGFIETRMTAAIPLATREVARRLCNLSQGGLPQDIAEAITFLASPGAAGLNGQVLRVCGGNFIGA